MLVIDLGAFPFSLDFSLASGQVFRWSKIGDVWTGIIDGKIMRTRIINGMLEVEVLPGDLDETYIHKYFRLGDNLPQIQQEITKDCIVGEAVRVLPGLRLVRQQPWECLASFICATYNNIPRIRGMVERICERFGEEISSNPKVFSFPSPKKLAKTTVEKLVNCGLGYRAPYLLEAARRVAEDTLDLERLRKNSYEEVKRQLTTLPGVGDKVADCVALFSLDKLEAFPVDVWIRRILTEHYRSYLPYLMKPCHSLTPRQYREANTFGRRYFGRYAGYAQQYLFTYHSTALRREWKGSCGNRPETGIYE